MGIFRLAIERLRKLYAFEIAATMQQQKIPEKELTKTLSIYHFSRRIADAVKEMADAEDNESESIAAAVVVLMASAGELVGLLERCDPRLAARAYELGLDSFDKKHKEYT